MFKYSIPIPVPLGTTLFEYSTDCCNACWFSSELSDERNQLDDNKIIKCNSSAPCHTRYLRVNSITFSYSNLEYVLENWNKKVFLTSEEAEKAGKQLVKEHIKEMRALGYDVTDDGKISDEILKAEHAKKKNLKNILQ